MSRGGDGRRKRRGGGQSGRRQAPERQLTPAHLPLYQEAREAAPAPALASDRMVGHAGLWWDKFCDVWNRDWSNPDTQVICEEKSGQAKSERPDKLQWILSLLHPRGRDRRVDREVASEARLRIGDPALLAEAHRRLGEMWRALNAHRRELELTAPFVTGTGLEHPTENGFVFHHTLGVPYLPASSLKGLLRAYAGQWAGAGQETIARIFGPEAKGAALHVGSVIVFDALPVEPVKLAVEITTPHYQPWYQAERPSERPPADWHDPIPIPFLVLRPGARFVFAVAPRRPDREQDREDAKNVAGWLSEALAWLGAGAKTALGFGRFEEPGTRDERDQALAGMTAKAAAARRPSSPMPGAQPGSERVTRPRASAGPLRDFPIGTRVVHVEFGEEAEVAGHKDNQLVLEFVDGTRELVSPSDVRRVA